MEKKRKACKECPWKNKYKHSRSWKEYAKKMTQVGKIENNIHACHMITHDTWGEKSPINKENVCIGSCENELEINPK